VKRADKVIVDVSELRPALLWEVELCQRLKLAHKVVLVGTSASIEAALTLFALRFPDTPSFETMDCEASVGWRQSNLPPIKAPTGEVLGFLLALILAVVSALYLTFETGRKIVRVAAPEWIVTHTPFAEDLLATYFAQGTANVLSICDDDRSERIRRELQRRFQEQALQPLLRRARSEDWQDRSCALKALGSLGNHAAIPVLNELFAQNIDEAAVALFRLGEDPLPRLFLRLKEGKDHTAPMNALYDIGKERVFPAAMDAYEAGELPLYVVSMLGATVSLDTLRRAFNSRAARRRLAVMDALMRREDPKSRDLIVSGTRDEDEEVRRAACDALERLSSTKGDELSTGSKSDTRCNPPRRALELD